MEIAVGNNILYRNQFVLGPRYAKNFSTWQNHEISNSIFLKSHPDLTITQLTKKEGSLTLLGYMIDTEGNHQNDKDILNQLLTEKRCATDLIKSTFKFCGNWILIFKGKNKTFLFHDCVGARSVYYTDINKTENLWVASQPSLIALAIKLYEDPKAVDFIMTQKTKTNDYWWPGEKSPYTEIKALLPNHFLDLSDGKVYRYWPDKNIKILNENEAVEKISKRLQSTMYAATQRFDIALALSGGLDSRVILAASKNIKDKICVYNGKRPEMSKNHPDIVIPQRLTKRCNIEYHYIPQTLDIEEEFAKAYFLNAPHVFNQILPGLQAELKYFGQKKVGATGNILEVARFGYKVFNPEHQKPSGEYLAKITKMKGSSFACEAFQNWLNKLGNTFNLNIYDLFHWEQRDGRWLSNNCLVFPMAWKEVLFPFNCRQLLIEFLSVSGSERMPVEYRFFKKLIQYMWPELLSEPINPKPHKGIFVKLKNNLKKIISLD